jgi:hypothetical protein
MTVTEQLELTQAEEPKEMIQSTPAQPARHPSASTLATSNRSSLSHPSDTSTAPNQTQIIEAVEKEFGKENFETKTAILNYVLNDTYQTAQELQGALVKLRRMRLDILMKLIT